jgi:hypothetical protein
VIKVCEMLPAQHNIMHNANELDAQRLHETHKDVTQETLQRKFMIM